MLLYCQLHPLNSVGGIRTDSYILTLEADMFARMSTNKNFKNIIQLLQFIY